MHAAIWVEPDTVDESQIVSTAPRKDDCRTSAETQWRSFVLKVPQDTVQPIVHATTDDAGCTRRCSGTTAAKSASQRGKTVSSATSAGDYAACALHCHRMHPRCASSGVHAPLCTARCDPMHLRRTCSGYGFPPATQCTPGCNHMRPILRGQVRLPAATLQRAPYRRGHQALGLPLREEGGREAQPLHRSVASCHR